MCCQGGAGGGEAGCADDTLSQRSVNTKTLQQIQFFIEKYKFKKTKVQYELHWMGGLLSAGGLAGCADDTVECLNTVSTPTQDHQHQHPHKITE